MTGFAAAIFILIIVYRFGLKRLRIATMAPMVIMILFLFGIGPFFGIPALAGTKRNITLIDLTYSARPLAQILNRSHRPAEPLLFSRCAAISNTACPSTAISSVLDYERDGVPGPAAHTGRT